MDKHIFLYTFKYDRCPFGSSRSGAELCIVHFASGRRKTSFHGALSLYGYDGGQGRSETSVDHYAWLMDLAMQGPYDDG